MDEQNTTQTQDEQAVADASSDVREEATVDEQEATPVDNDTSAEVADTDAAADGDTEVTLEEALSALAAVRAESEKHKDAWQRERAEFVNYKKRVERERVEAYESAAADVMKSLLPIIDDFERAVANIPEDQAETPWVEGTVAIERKLARMLEKYDIEPLDPVGEPFDPDAHQALGVDEEAEVESGHVSETLQRGYRKGDKLLRPALVRVAG